MKDRELNIPAALRELHGEKAKLSNLILVYCTSFIVSSVFIYLLLPLKLVLWKNILAALLILDISGGVVANLSSPVNQYYQKKKSLRIVFLLLHFLQPLGFFIIFPGMPFYFLYIFLFAFISALIVNSIKSTELQQNMASGLVAIGILLSFLFRCESPVLYALAPLFMIKLILGFAVRRPDLSE